MRQEQAEQGRKVDTPGRGRQEPHLFYHASSPLVWIGEDWVQIWLCTLTGCLGVILSLRT